MPSETRAALQTVMDSPIGDKIRAAGTSINVVLTRGLASAFQVIDGTIYYHTDVSGYLAAGQEWIIPGDGTGSATLGSLLAHEVGHVIGVNAPTTTRANEAWTVRNFENPYRSHMGMPLRRSYFEEDDVFK